MPPGVDLPRLAAWLGSAEEPDVRLIAGGRSNLTYQVVHRGRTMVLRRPPLGHVLATAHDMHREYTVLTALAPTPVPVPATLAYCADPAVIGAPFYLMEYVDGVVYRDAAALRGLDAAAGRALGYALADTLAALHAVDPEAVGLGDFGRPEGFLERQIRRWRAQLAASTSRPLPGAEALARCLADRQPHSAPPPEGRAGAGTPPAGQAGAGAPAEGRAGAGTPAVVHGDFRLDNVIVDRGRIAAVLDWEMSTLGDPLTDLGVMCVYWDGLSGFGDAVPPSPGHLPGWPSRAELVERYARAGGRDPAGLDWYVAFGYFKLAVILEGIHYRHTQGLTVGPGFEHIGAAVPELIARGHATLGHATPG